MQALSLKWFLSTERKRAAIVTLLWGAGMSFTFAQGLIQRTFLEWYDYAIAFALCVIAGAVIIDLTRALASYIAAMFLAIVLTLSLLITPALLGAIPSPGDIVITNLWIAIVFDALFPFPLFGFLLATFAGAALGERFL
jgi:hypothetical protein